MSAASDLLQSVPAEVASDPILCARYMSEMLLGLMIDSSKGADPVEDARELLAAGASALHQNEWGDTALHRAAEAGRARCVELLAPLSDVNARDDEGDSPLLIACKHEAPNAVAIARVLLAAGADADLADREGWTPLMYAATHESSELTQILLPQSNAKRRVQARSEPDASDDLDSEADECPGTESEENRTSLGKTALMIAADNANIGAIRALLPASDPLAGDDIQHTALHYLIRSAAEKTSGEWTAALHALLPAHKGQEEKGDQFGRTLLDLAIMAGRVEAAKMLAPLSPRFLAESWAQAVFTAMRPQARACVDAASPWAEEETSREVWARLVARDTASLPAVFPQLSACMERLALKDAMALAKDASSAGLETTRGATVAAESQKLAEDAAKSSPSRRL